MTLTHIYIYMYMRTALRNAALRWFKLFTLHPSVFDIISARVYRYMARTHPRTHTVPSTLCRSRILWVPVFYPVYLQLHRAGNTVERRKSVGTSPEGGENSLKIPNVYSYNLHVIISDMPAGPRIYRADTCIPAYIHDRMYNYNSARGASKTRGETAGEGMAVPRANHRARGMCLECPSRFISSAF